MRTPRPGNLGSPLLVLALVGLTACELPATEGGALPVPGSPAGPKADDPAGGGGDAPEPQDMISANGWQPDVYSVDQLSTEPLTAAWAQRLVSQPAGRELMTYLALCALPANVSLDVAGQHYPGHLGLAPEWRDGACSGSCQRWISACVFAHANGHGERVYIRIAGPHPALRQAPVATPYQFQESAFWGNMFRTIDGEYPVYSCLGTDFEGDPAVYEGDWRTFCEHERCGIRAEGWCRRSEVDGLGLCDDVRDGAYPRCYPPEYGLEPPWEGYDEVITIYLQRGGSAP